MSPTNHVTMNTAADQKLPLYVDPKPPSYVDPNPSAGGDARIDIYPAEKFGLDPNAPVGEGPDTPARVKPYAPVYLDVVALILTTLCCWTYGAGIGGAWFISYMLWAHDAFGDRSDVCMTILLGLDAYLGGLYKTIIVLWFWMWHTYEREGRVNGLKWVAK